jgi:pyridinium-3,5-biscarboxylic acid mononucleotide synthase
VLDLTIACRPARRPAPSDIVGLSLHREDIGVSSPTAKLPDEDPSHPAGLSPGGPRTPFEARLRDLLDQVANGVVSADEAAATLRDLPFADLGFAKVDHHRELRQGACEIVLAAGKSADQVEGIVRQLIDGNVGPVLVTRADADQIDRVRRVASRARLATTTPTVSGAVAVLRNVPEPVGRALIVTAGTADIPVADEARLTATLLGAGAEMVTDAGVAGLHRIASVRDRLDEADVVVVVAGMEGALASVVGGLVSCPVIACPTSVGYGASFGGLAALLAMLSSCTPGVVCVDIDDGVGAGYTAALIARRAHGSGRPRADEALDRPHPAEA